MAQLSLLDLNPNEIERPFEVDDYVNGISPDGLHLTGYVIKSGIRYLVLGHSPRSSLNYRHAIYRHSAQRCRPPAPPLQLTIE